MYIEGIISQAVFAISLGGQSEESYLDVGVIQTTAMRSPKDLVYLDAILGKKCWENYMTGVRFVTKSHTKAFSTESMVMKTDIGTKCNYVPTRYFEAFLEVLISYFPSKYAKPDILDYPVPCELIGDLPRIDVLYGGHWM